MKPVAFSTDLSEQKKVVTCLQHGDYTSDSFTIPGISTHWSPCPECDKVREQAAQEYEAKRVQERIERDEKCRLGRTYIPARFANAEVTNYKTNTEKQELVARVVSEYVADFSTNLKNGRCLILLGKPGCGKTHLACGIANAIDRKHYRVRYVTAVAMIREIRDSWRKDSDITESEVLVKLRRYDLLIIDEVGVQFGSDAELTQLTEVLDLRYQDMRPTIVVSNCDMAGIVRFMGERSVDRLRENNGTLLTFDWSSWRRGEDGI